MGLQAICQEMKIYFWGLGLVSLKLVRNGQAFFGSIIKRISEINYLKIRDT